MLQLLIAIFTASAVYLFTNSLILSASTLIIILAFCWIFNRTLKDLFNELDEQADLQLQKIFKKAKIMTDAELVQAIIDEDDDEIKAVLQKEFFFRLNAEKNLYD